MSRLRADTVLLLVALIWGSAFAVQRVAAQYFDPFTFNGLRFLLGGLVLFPFSKLNPFRITNRIPSDKDKLSAKSIDAPKLDRKSISFIFLSGVLLFGAAGLQQAGLETTTAGNAGFITTLYVVFVPVILLIFFKEKIHQGSLAERRDRHRWQPVIKHGWNISAGTWGCTGDGRSNFLGFTDDPGEPGSKTYGCGHLLCRAISCCWIIEYTNELLVIHAL